MADTINNTNKYLNYDGLTTLWGRISEVFVRKDGDKVLSDNNFSDDNLTKLDGIETGAQVNVIEGVAVRSKNADGTYKTSQLTNAAVSEQDYSVAVLDVETDLSSLTADVDPLHVASAYGVKSYVDSKIADKNVDAEGDDYVSATASGNKVTIAATESTIASLGKADTAIQGVGVTGDSYVTATESDAHEVTLSTKTQAVSTATESDNGLAVALDVKSYVDQAEADAIASVVGTNNDTATANTIYGAKAYAKTYVDDQINAINETIESNEKVTAEALNDLDGRVADLEAINHAQILDDAKAYTDDRIDDRIGFTDTTVKSYVDGAITEVTALVTASTQFLGVSSVAIADKSTTVPVINGTSVTPGAGDIVMYETKEFIWDGAKWVLLGDVTAEFEAIEALKGRMGIAEGEIDTLQADLGTRETDGGTAFDRIRTLEAIEVTASGDDYVSASATGHTVTVGATESTIASLGKADSALQSVTGGTYINVEDKANNSQKINAVTKAVVDATESDNGLAVAYDVKSYVDGEISDLDSTSSTNDTTITKVATEVTQTDGKVAVTYTNFESITNDEIIAICQ